MKMKQRNDIYSRSILGTLDPAEENRIKNQMLVAKMIRDYLISQNITQQEFARMMRKKSSEISEWLSGHHNFTIDTLSDISHILGTDFLFYEDKTMERCRSRVNVVNKKSDSIILDSTGEFSHLHCEEKRTLIAEKNICPA